MGTAAAIEGAARLEYQVKKTQLAVWLGADMGNNHGRSLGSLQISVFPPGWAR